ncbi:MAG: tetratricopeptide repeat protein [Candidatus Omnitrophota bacterium]|nr:tetratricopeptide repeat protein [Candidatus Omnitrophota bacterium]
MSAVRRSIAAVGLLVAGGVVCHWASKAEGATRGRSQEARVFRDQGYQAQQQGDFQTAIRYYEQAIQVDPAYATPYNDLGAVYETLGQPDKAKEAYRVCLKANPSYPDAYANLAALYEAQGDMMSAASYWKRRAQLGSPDDPWTQKARQRWEELAKGDPRLAPARSPSGVTPREQGAAISQAPVDRQAKDDVSVLYRDHEITKSELSWLTKTNDSLTEMVQDISHNVQDLTQKTQTIEPLKQELQASRKSLDRLEQLREDLVDQLRRERLTALEQLEELREANATLETRAKGLTQAHEQEKARLEQELAALHKQSQTELAKLQRTLKEEQAKVTTSQGELQTLTQAKTALETTAQEQAGANKRLQAELDTLHSTLRETQATVATQQDDLEQLSRAKADLEAKVKELTQVQQEKARLEQELAASRKTLQEEQTKVAAERYEVQTLSHAKAALETTAQELTRTHQQEHGRLETELATLRRTLQESQTTVATHRGELQTLTQTNADLETKVKEGVGVNAYLQTELAALRKSLQEEQAKVRTAQGELQTLSQGKASLETTVQELTRTHQQETREQQAQLAAVRKLLQEEQTKVVDQKVEAQELSRINTALETKVQGLTQVQQENTRLEQELAASRKTLQEEQAKVAAERYEIQTLSHAKAALETTAQELTRTRQKETQEHQAQVALLRKMLQEEQAKVASHWTEVQTLTQAKAVLETRVREMTPAHQQKQQLEQQLTELTKTTKFQQETLYHELGVAYTQLQAYTKAIEAFEKALRLNPDNPQTHYHLGLLYKQARKDLQKASHHLRTYLQLSPQASDRKQLEVLLTLMQRERPQSPAP